MHLDAVFVPILIRLWVLDMASDAENQLDRTENQQMDSGEDWYTTRTIHRCNSVLAGLPASSIRPLQRVQNAAARLVLNLDYRVHITPALQQPTLATS